MRKCDELSWEEFYHIYWPLVNSIGQRLGISKDHTMDLMQEIMFDLFKNDTLRHYDASKGKFRTFLGVLIRHKVSRMLQSPGHSLLSDTHASNGPVSSGLTNSSAMYLDSQEENDPFQKMFDEEYRNCLLSLALNELRNSVGSKTYAIFEMVVLQHRSPQDVARFLGISRAVIAVYCSRCRKKLRKIAAEIRTDNTDFNLGIP